MKTDYLNDASQMIAEAIAAVLNTDVTIMNANMVRIAGTGVYKERVGQEIEQSTAFGVCLNTGNPCIVEESKNGEICAKCNKIDACIEKAEICMPIKYKDKVVGVIGVIAFENTQREKILSNKSQYFNFISKMAELLEAKYSESIILTENTLLSSRLDKILNSVQDALLVFQGAGEILYKNIVISNMLNSLGIQDHDSFIAKIIDSGIIKSAIKDNLELSEREMAVEHDGKSYSFVISVFSMQAKSNEYVLKLQDIKEYKRRILLYTQNTHKNESKLGFNDILSKSDNFIEVKKLAAKAAHSNSNILIYGESGTGKEMFARAIHNSSSRSEHAFVAINCGAIPDELFESELFGHEKGAFTGAINTKLGKFEIADKGTIFLDEISEMPYNLQVKLLRALQESEICRIGNNTTKKIDVRIIAATNAELPLRIEKGLFRADLYYRINIIPIHIPPLRERDQDILYLADHFIKHYSRIIGNRVEALSDEAQKIFINYDWPGNVRELQNVIEYAVNFTETPVISKNLICMRLNITTDIKASVHTPFSGDKPLSPECGKPLSTNLNEMEQQLIIKKVEQYSNLKHKEIIRLLCSDFSVSRTTLYRKLKKYGIVI